MHSANDIGLQHFSIATLSNVGIHECHEFEGLQTLNSARKRQINVSAQQQVQELTAQRQTTAELMHYRSKNPL